MTDLADKIGVIRQHRWLSADEQRQILGQRCSKVVSLGGGSAQVVTREDLERLARPGTIVELVHAFLLADPRRKQIKGGLQADFRAALARLDKRGAKVVDVDAQICSGKHRKAMLALVDSDLARSNRGAKSATNGAKSRGRPSYDPSPEELEKAVGIWGNTRSYPEWPDADKALRTKVNKQFTMWRAYEEFGPRKATKT